MEKIQIYLRKEELDTLRKAAAGSGRSGAELVRDAIRKVVLKPQAAGPVAIGDGTPKRTSIEHESVHDEPRCGRGRRCSLAAGADPDRIYVRSSLCRSRIQASDIAGTAPLDEMTLETDNASRPHTIIRS